MNFPFRPRMTARALAFSLLPLLPSAAYGADATLQAPGADAGLADRLRGASASVAASGETNVQELLAAALSDYRTLVQVLYDAGHFAPVVNIRLDGREAALIQPLNPPQNVSKVDITVQPGPRFSFGKAELSPLPRQSDVEYPEEFAPGQPASTGAIRDAAVAGVRAWRRSGHAKATVAEQRITANHLQARLDAQLRLAPGPRLRFGRITVTGDTRVREEAIRKIAGFPAGEEFHPDLIAKSATRLRRTGTFSSVVLREAEQPNPDGTLDFTAVVEDLPPRRLTFGAEISSSDGVELSGSWMHRNLFGAAEKLRIEARLSGIGSSNDIDGRVAVRLDRPAALGPDDLIFYLIEAEQLDEEHYKATQVFGAAGVRRTFSDTFFAEAALGVSSTLAEDVFGQRRFKYIAGRLRAEYDGRDSRVNPASGYYLQGTATPFIGFGGSKSGLQIEADGRAYWGLGADDRIVLAGRLQLGSVAGPSLSEISPTLLFFSGGAGTVRGHEYQSLGVPVGGGTAGGRSFAALSGEVRGKVTDTISLVGFYDIGFVDADSFVSSSSARHAGAGIGLRYDVAGIGPIRLDLAYPVDGGSEDGLQFYIGIGQAF
ncbi:autotransporter assembly complex protein TamA [Leisingera caerulea]|uniref:Autotransporter assembly complex protein TamA n=1 Tax=Leisingera caerulea TaxID=506591 RepID=A0A9Q9LXF2_LEICA|nr:autotransporter assembly complex family protein [Leisingera caerulea]UWQ52986.1 autotransporter assembly complex protein TamA [Leisingera caerulea]